MLQIDDTIVAVRKVDSSVAIQRDSMRQTRAKIYIVPCGRALAADGVVLGTEPSLYAVSNHV